VPPPVDLEAMSTPRSHKRKIPVIPTDEDQEEAAPIAAPAPVAPVAPVEPALVVASPSKKVEPENEEDAYTAEEEERARIWDMFAEEYHDSQSPRCPLSRRDES
jgi:hypothetical protein